MPLEVEVQWVGSDVEVEGAKWREGGEGAL